MEQAFEYSLTEVDQISKIVLNSISTSNIVLLYGEMGVGKTTLIKTICSHLGVLDHVSSPTFSIVNEYLSGNQKIYHFDLYRLKDEIEAEDLGFSEYLLSGNLCFIEWPEKIKELLSFYKTIKLHLYYLNSSSRRIILTT